MDRRSNKSQMHDSPISIGPAVGSIVGLVLLAFSMMTALGICSDTSIAEALFPYSMIILRSASSVSPWLMITFIQYPIYGVICGSLVRAKRTYRYWMIPILLLVMGLHIFAVMLVQGTVIF